MARPMTSRLSFNNKYTAAAKVAGSRRSSTANPKGKGKVYAVVNTPSKALRRKAVQLKDCDMKKPCGGCENSTANYSEEDIDALHDILEGILPIGGKAWEQCRGGFCFMG